MTSTRHTPPAAHAAPTFRRRWGTLLPQAAVLLSAMTLAACGGGSDPTRCNGLPCTPSYSVDTDDLAIRVELASDGSRVGGTARLDTGDDLGVPVVLDDEELLLRQGGGEIEFRADDDETVHQTVGTLPAVPGAMYVLRFEREWRRIEGNVVLPPHYEVLAPAAGSVIGSSVAAALAVDTDLSVVDTMRARADLTCTLADNRRVGPRGHDLAVGQAVATTGGSRRLVDLAGGIAAFEGTVGSTVTDCDVRLGTSVQNLGDMPAALDGRSFIVARFVRALNLRYVRD